MRHYPLVVSALMLCVSSVSAEVVLDGSDGGPSGSIGLVNGTYSIDVDTDAKATAGTNAFFSFSDFNVEAGNSANFTSGSATSYDNLLARVTGSSASLIDGHIGSDIAGASLWLINPNGVVFGQGSSVELGGSLHVTTGNYIKLPGIEFYADAAQPFVAVAGNPLGVGTVAGMAEIQLTGSDLVVAPGESISVIGGDIHLEGSHLSAVDGNVQLLSISDSGEVLYSDNVYQSNSASRYGKVQIDASAMQLGTNGKLVVVADEVQRTEGSDYLAATPVTMIAQTTQLGETEVKCRPKVFSGGVPMEFQVQEKEEGKHYFVRLSGSVSKSGKRHLQDCVQP